MINANPNTSANFDINLHRFYNIGGMTVQIRADLPITDATFPKMNCFQGPGPGCDNLLVTHHFSIPRIDPNGLGRQLYSRTPWTIFKRNDEWVYLGISQQPDDWYIHQLGIFNHDHTIGNIYNPTDLLFRLGGLTALTFLPTDQILLARVLADRHGSLFHSAAITIDGQGFLFIGHSGAGKSTIVTILRDAGEILCDDRNIVRHSPEGWRVYGTWSHGDVPDVSPASAPLRAILLLEQASENRLTLIEDRREIVRQLPFFIIKPLITADWWEKTLDLVGAIAREVPVYRLQFDRSGRVIDVLRSLL